MAPQAPRASHDPVAILAPAIEALTGRSHTDAQLRRFRQYLDLLVAWNRTHRLTGFRSAEAIARGLFQDSLLFLARLPAGPVTMVDIGAGAGIPGVPLHRPELSESFEVVVARAVGVHLLPTAMRYLKPGGLFVASGPPAERAETPAQRAIAARWETIPFPELGISRTFLVGHKPA